MRRIPPTLIFVVVAGVVFGVVDRYFLDDPSEANLAFYLRSAVHGLLVAVFG